MKTHFLNKTRVRQLMRDKGAYVVEDDAVMKLRDYLEEQAKRIAKEATSQATTDDRNKVMADDIATALGGYVEIYD